MPQTLESASPVSAATARYDSLLVHVEPGLPASRRVEVAAGLSRRFKARLIGLGAEALEPPVASDPYSSQLLAEMVVEMTRELEARQARAAEDFGRDAAQAHETEWRTSRAMPNAALAAEARACDLIVMGAREGRGASGYQAADPGEVVLTAARPVLVVPEGAERLEASRIVLAWKETREARRALLDALPFLVAAEEVVVMAVCAENAVEVSKAQVDDVAGTLRRRGVPARSLVVTAPDASVVDELNAEAANIGADLIVCGAYGHSRTREWVFGGVTRTLLRAPGRYLLLSH
ncbi:universal stress protein [Phenylobacterium sp. J367]|uniref:universal stress protein n=1 Tax=Phenylobacterium sp. J367 TaxID=2898435 RepID=UPI0021517D15|nr:universal stress protein [Phenylobacterium sp. J367]MCR5881058.1 universal stress protein [Phenylobacterium sp. J367]